MPIYCYTCTQCGQNFDEVRQMADRDDAGECSECKGVAVRDFTQEVPHPEQEYHTPIEMLSVAVHPKHSNRLQQRLGSNIEVRNGVPIAKTRHQKLKILKAMGYSEGN